MWTRVAQCRVALFKLDLKQKSEFKWFKIFSNLFKLWSIIKVLSYTQKKERNNFLYRNFLRFGMDFELKFREFCMS
jgi:hypothetical protein